jgi:hypothetical protein
MEVSGGDMADGPGIRTRVTRLAIFQNGVPAFRKLAQIFYLSRLCPPRLCQTLAQRDFSGTPADCTGASKLAAVLAPGVAQELAEHLVYHIFPAFSSGRG